MRIGRLLTILAAPLLLVSCLLTPGKFVSSLDIRADRSFTFAYAGEAILLDPSGNSAYDVDGVDATGQQLEPGAASKPETEDMIVKRRAIAEALSKEVGYRAAEYLGDGKFRVDYATTGRLDRHFVYPFNSDAQAIIPWIAIELRKDGSARIKAPAFGESQSGPASPMNPLDDAARFRDGTFTLTTDADLVMHNNEQGKATGPITKVVWTVTPTSKTVPTAVVRFAD